MNVLQRYIWDGKAREVAVWWTLHREEPQGEAVCRMFTHIFGHELRLEVRGELVDSKVCRTDEDVLAYQEVLRAGLENKGWKKA